VRGYESRARCLKRSGGRPGSRIFKSSALHRWRIGIRCLSFVKVSFPSCTFLFAIRTDESEQSLVAALIFASRFGSCGAVVWATPIWTYCQVAIASSISSHVRRGRSGRRKPILPASLRLINGFLLSSRASR
jgi:hypothetical protein